MGNKARILIVDRNNNVCRLLARELGAEGYFVDTIDDGTELINIIKADSAYDLMILDPDRLYVAGKSLFEILNDFVIPFPVIIYTSCIAFYENSALKGGHLFMEKNEPITQLKTIIEKLIKLKKRQPS